MKRALIMLILFIGLLLYVFLGLTEDKNLNGATISLFTAAFMLCIWDFYADAIRTSLGGAKDLRVDFLYLVFWVVFLWNALGGLWGLTKYLKFID